MRYSNMYELFENEEIAEDYFSALPIDIRIKIENRADSIDSFEALSSYALSFMR